MRLGKKDISDKTRMDHMSALEKESIIQTICEKQGILIKHGEKLSATTSLKHKIVTTDNEPVYTKSYRYPQHFKQDVHKQISEMLENGIIRHSKSPYSAPIWVVPKKMDALGK